MISESPAPFFVATSFLSTSSDASYSTHIRSPPDVVIKRVALQKRSVPRKSKQVSIDRSWELEILNLLGEGSFGAVYKAQHKPSSAVVAVKIITNASSSASEEEKIKGEIDIQSAGQFRGYTEISI